MSKSLQSRILPIVELKVHPQNYNDHPEDQIEHLKQSIRENGIYRNIVIANDNTILAGHGVVEAAADLGYREVPVIQLDVSPDSPQALKVLVGDNEVSHLSEKNDRLLTEILKELKDSEDLDLMGTGFDDMMLANLVYVTRPKSEIEDFDAAAEWVGMPEYEDGQDIFKLVINFTSEEDREKFVREKELSIVKKVGKTWASRWPDADREDVSGIQFKG
jgi:hypothetical protein